jgi:prepilin-type N-terminal cleavage/methylation domain-containing protein
MTRIPGDLPRGTHREGFSLVELVYVLVLSGIVLSMAIPRIDVKRARVDAAATQAVSQLIRAQRVAVLRQHDVRVSFDETQSRMLVHEDVDNDGTVESGEPTRVSAIEDGTMFGVVGSVLFGSSALTFAEDEAGLPTVTFHRNGSASEEGALHLTSVSPVGTEHDRAIRIRRATGMAQCWSRRTGTWTQGC